MPLRLSEILEHDAPHLHITTRRQLLAFYDALVGALKEGALTPEGGALPTTLNSLLRLLPGDPAPAKRDRELTDWSVENDARYAAFLEAWRARKATRSADGPKPRALAAPLYQTVRTLETLRSGPSKKADLEAAVDTFLAVYRVSQHALRLPPLPGDVPGQLPEGVVLDERKVTLGRDPKGTYVGLVRKKA